MFLLQDFFFGPLKKRNMERNSFFLAGFLEEFPRIPGTGISKKRNPKRMHNLASKYLFPCARRKFGLHKKIRRNLLRVLFTCITNLILALYMQSANGLEEPFQDSRKMFLQPTCSGCTVGLTIFPCIIGLVYKNPSYVECIRYSPNISLIYVKVQ